MKILVVDKFEESGLARLRAISRELAYEQSLKDQALADKVASFDPNILIVRSTKVTRPIIEAGKAMQLIIRAGSGYDNIDVSAASSRGVSVANCPGMNAVAVAELTLGLIVSLDRSIPDNVADFRAGKWNKKLYAARALGLKGRTLGIIGAGKIGTEVARRALAFDMRVLYTHLGRSRGLVDFPSARRTEMSELLRESDVVSIHVPGGSNTTNLLDAQALSLLKPSALLINTSRAGVVDERVLADMLRSKRIRGAALDVFEGEPAGEVPSLDSPLRDVPNLYVTHHIGASTEEAQQAVADETLRIVAHFRSTNEVLNCVNMSTTPPNSLLVVKFRNKPGGLAHVFNIIAGASINVEEMDHVVFEGGQTAVAHIRVTPPPDERVLERLRSGHDNVLGVELLSA